LDRWGVIPEQLTEEPPIPALPHLLHPYTDDIRAIKQAITALQQKQTVAIPAYALRLATGITRLHHHLNQLDASLTRQQQHDAARPAWGHLRGQLFPKTGRQERVMSLFQVLWEFGPGIVDQMITCATKMPPAQHGWMKIS
jgi:hypothetical protein